MSGHAIGGVAALLVLAAACSGPGAGTGAVAIDGVAVPQATSAVDIARDVTEFRAAAPGRIHLAAHSQHYWPDAACAASHSRI